MMPDEEMGIGNYSCQHPLAESIFTLGSIQIKALCCTYPRGNESSGTNLHWHLPCCFTEEARLATVKG